jgi:hypothetical protein
MLSYNKVVKSLIASQTNSASYNSAEFQRSESIIKSLQALVKVELGHTRTISHPKINHLLASKKAMTFSFMAIPYSLFSFMEFFNRICPLAQTLHHHSTSVSCN